MASQERQKKNKAVCDWNTNLMHNNNKQKIKNTETVTEINKIELKKKYGLK